MSTENTTEHPESDSEHTESSDNSDVNMSRLREMAIRGKEYRESIDFEYYDETGELYVKPLTDAEFLPIAALLEDRLDIDEDEAQEMLEDEKDETGVIDASAFDEEFVRVMQEAAILGIDTSQGIAEGEDRDGVTEIVEMLQGGKTLEIAEVVLSISSDAEQAESFRRDGGGE